MHMKIPRVVYVGEYSQYKHRRVGAPDIHHTRARTYSALHYPNEVETIMYP